MVVVRPVLYDAVHVVVDFGAGVAQRGVVEYAYAVGEDLVDGHVWVVECVHDAGNDVLEDLDGDEAGMRKYAFETAGISDEQFPLFASAITGRDYTVLTKKQGVVQARTSEEKKVIGDALGEGLLEDLIQLLGKVPRVILLILKTNDLSLSPPFLFTFTLYTLHSLVRG